MHSDSDWLINAAQTSLERLLPRITPAAGKNSDIFLLRLKQHFPNIFPILHTLYGHQYDFFYYLEQILLTTARCYAERPAELKTLDRQRESDATWLQSEQMMGAFCYVDLFAGDLTGLRRRAPYLKELGLTYLHLMPLFRAPDKNNDGGYAVSSFREVNPRLGTMDELRALAHELRQQGISLVVDMVFNHTSNEHDWAQKARAGDRFYQQFYRFFPDRTLPDQYEPHLREIFPEQSPGSFTYLEDMGQWVWTTFYDFQWDLNYENPEVFRAMLEEMYFLANQGIEILRLDAVPFIWKQLGTNCENLPQAHMLIQVYNNLMRVAAPALLFKSEAIVHPRDIASYIGWGECPISYNPTLMVGLWEALATREVKLLLRSMQSYFALPEHSVWINYIRSHDDIGWGFADEDAAAVGINPFDHRWFLNHFYTGEFEGSFAIGAPFNYNPVTQDMRISGTTASLAGLERAVKLGDPLLIEHAIRRIVLMHSIILSAGGIPLLNLGDELGTLNDYAYLDNAAKAADSRWMHRPPFDWDKAALRTEPAALDSRTFQQILRLIRVRQQTPALGCTSTTFFDTRNGHLLGYTRDRVVLILCNFSDHKQSAAVEILSRYWAVTDFEQVTDLVTGEPYPLGDWITLDPLRFVWLMAHPKQVDTRV